MTDWSAIRDDFAAELIGDLGGEVTITSSARGTYEPIPGRTVTRGEQVAAQTGTFTAALVEADVELGTGDLVESCKEYFVVAPGPFLPRPTDKITYGDSSLQILAVKHVRPDGQTLVYSECEVAL